jgi:plasmid stabilization system protein ParE
MYWYNTVKPDLGKEFGEKIEETIKILTKHPKIAATLYLNYRKISLKRFPHSIIYVINEEKQEVQIIAVQHHKQHPEAWKTEGS